MYIEVWHRGVLRVEAGAPVAWALCPRPLRQAGPAG